MTKVRCPVCKHIFAPPIWAHYYTGKYTTSIFCTACFQAFLPEGTNLIPQGVPE